MEAIKNTKIESSPKKMNRYDTRINNIARVPFEYPMIRLGVSILSPRHDDRKNASTALDKYARLTYLLCPKMMPNFAIVRTSYFFSVFTEKYLRKA